MKQNTDKDRQKRMFVYVFEMPIVGIPEWCDVIPNALKEDIISERLVQAIRDHDDFWKRATPAEALAYLYTASLEAPMGDEWYEVYYWLSNQWANGHGRELLDGLASERDLNDHERALLGELTRWIRRKQLEAMKRKERARPAKRAAFDIAERLSLFAR